MTLTDTQQLKIEIAIVKALNKYQQMAQFSEAKVDYITAEARDKIKEIIENE